MSSKLSAKLAARGLLAFLVLVIVSITAVPVYADPPDPQPLPATGNCYRDNIFYGAVPPGGQNAPVIVFVHGYSGLAIDWWLRVPPVFDNDMYVRAYNAGYRTAFVNLNVDPAAANCAVVRTPAKSTIYNGFVLGLQLQAITQHYGVAKVDIVAHSKGGIDSQSAVLWFGGAARVRNIFTLSSPHQGSLLADLLWSPQGAALGWLLGRRDDGTFSIRTGSMQLFRAVADPSPVDDLVAYHSAAGTEWRNGGPGLAITGAWLEAQPTGGINDGAVTVNSTYLPYASTLFQQPWDHLQMYMGRNAFPYILAALQGSAAPEPASLAAPGASHSLFLPSLGKAYRPAAPVNAAMLPAIVHGGSLAAPLHEELPIEPQVRSVQFKLYTSGSGLDAAMVGPDGTVYPFGAAPAAGYGLPQMAAIQQVTVRQPGAGQWRLRVNGPGSGGYLLTADLDSPLRVQLGGLPDRVLSPGATLHLSAAGQPAGALDIQRLAVQLSSASGNITTLSAGAANLDVPLPNEQGIQGFSATVSGETSGFPFERTYVRSVAVVDLAALAGDPWRLDQLLRP
ncbi:MAG: hypothetical protein R2844_04600 [Caldilineales bacterium]